MKAKFYGGALDGQERDDVLGQTVFHALRDGSRWTQEKYECAHDRHERAATGELLAVAFRFVAAEDITERMRQAAESLRRDSMRRALEVEEVDGDEGLEEAIRAAVADMLNNPANPSRIAYERTRAAFPNGGEEARAAFYTFLDEAKRNQETEP